MNTRDSLYETVTNDIIAEMEQGVAPWVKPWTAEGGGLPLLPYNAMTHKQYHGVNVLILRRASMLKGYRNPAWIGFHQAHALGGHVKKDEKSTVIVYGSTFVPKEERRKPEEEQKRVPFLKKRIVFNVEQTAGLPSLVYLLPEPVPIADALEHVEDFLRKIGANVHPLRGPEIRTLRCLEREGPTDGAYVFLTERGGPMTAAGFRKMLSRAKEESTLGFPAQPHMLRHGCGFKLANNGHDTRAIQHYLGHKNIQHTVRYTELSSDRFKGFWKD